MRSKADIRESDNKELDDGRSCNEPSDQTGYPTLTVNRKTGDVRAACCEKTRLALRR